jgi:hypothetical protein
VPNDNIVKLIQPGTVSDPLTEILRNGAQALLVQAVEAERISADAVSPGSRRAREHDLPRYP